MINFKDEIAELIAQHVEGLELSEIQDIIEVPQDQMCIRDSSKAGIHRSRLFPILV